MRTSIQVETATIEALRLARAEMATISRYPLKSNDDALIALMAYWDANKRDTHGLTTAPVLVPGGAPEQAHQDQQ